MNGLFDNLLMAYFGTKTFRKDYFWVECYTPYQSISIGSVGEGSGYPLEFDWSEDGETWTTSSSVPVYEAPKKIYIRRNCPSWHTSDSSGYRDYMNLDLMNCKLGGNIMSLIYGENFDEQTEFPTGTSHNFMMVFSSSPSCPRGILDASELVLPATTLTEGCYNSMFSYCHYMTSAPELPATTLADYCYHSMFSGCSSLTSAPALPATILARYCYDAMFSGCTNITTPPALPATTIAEYCYGSMFSGCTALTSTPALPASTLADYCYLLMFNNCTSLTTAPTMSSTSLARGCYEAMFSGCSHLTSAPALPATTLTERCYSSMFENCTSLVTAPDLLAPTLLEGCYLRMFYGCSNLNYIKCTTTSDVRTTYPPYSYKAVREWVKGVNSTGTFVKNSGNNSWPTGDDGIPSGWTVQNA